MFGRKARSMLKKCLLLAALGILICFFYEPFGKNKPNFVVETWDQIRYGGREYVFNGPVDYSTNETNPKYVIYECADSLCGGWGDRLKGILSAYAWSILTDRNFRIYLTYPCPLQNLLEPTNLTHWNSPLATSHQTRSRFYKQALDDKKFAKKLTDLDITQYHAEKDILVFKNNYDWLESFSRNVNLRDKLRSLGFSDPSRFKLVYLFRQLYQLLFQLGPDLQADYEYLLQRRQEASSLICAQIRIGGKREHVDYDFQFNTRNASLLFWDFIRKNLTNTKNDFRLFVTTDLEEVAEEALHEFGSDRVILNDGPYIHIDREKPSQDCFRVKKTLLDLHFMQHCDRVIISDSNYGKFGIMLRPEPIRDAFILKDGKISPVDYGIKF